MENKILLIFILILLFILEKLYFKVATKFNILDRPNQRSLHSKEIIRGGGVIVVFAVVLFFFLSKYQYPLFFTGLILIATISFLDDIFTLSNKVRIFVQFISIGLLVSQLGISTASIIVPIFLIAIIAGIINAYNFMDGINGLTGSYSFVCLATLLYLNTYNLVFINPNLLYFILCSLLVFSFFNFRKNAECFAGDVGSISLGFVICFLIASLILKTNEFKYILFLAVYGIDSILTIIQRLLKKENIFKAHKLHLYQLMVEKLNFSHLQVSSIYLILQLFINLIVIFIIDNEQYLFQIYLILGFCIMYVALKRKILNIEKPFNKIA